MAEAAEKLKRAVVLKGRGSRHPSKSNADLLGCLEPRRKRPFIIKTPSGLQPARDLHLVDTETFSAAC